MTTEEYFKSLASKQEITVKEQDHISKKHNFLREKLREKLEVEDDFLTGSYSRNTMIRPNGEDKFDVDFFLVFNKKNYGEKELPDLLKLVKDALEKIKEEDDDILEIQDQKRSVGIIYKENFQIDVVPAIQIEKDKRYKIFDKGTLSAIESNPKLHGQNLTDANESSISGEIKRLVPIIKILKSWKRNKCNYVKSFHLEILAVEILKDTEIKSFSEGLTKFYTSASAYLQRASLADPANEDNIIDAYLDKDGTRRSILDLIEKEKNIANNAIKYEENGDDNNSLKEWKKIFEKDDDDVHKTLFRGARTTVVASRTPEKPWHS